MPIKSNEIIDSAIVNSKDFWFITHCMKRTKKHLESKQVVQTIVRLTFDDGINIISYCFVVRTRGVEPSPPPKVHEFIVSAITG